MNNTTTSRFHLLRLALILACILALTVSTALSAGMERAQDPTALVRVDVPDEADLARLATLGLPVYVQLQTQAGAPYLILPATPEQQRMISGMGFSLTVLDSNAEAGSAYYLIYARTPEQLASVNLSVQILEQDGRKAIAKASSGEALRAIPGVEIVQLKLHKLVADHGRQPGAPEQIEPDPTIQEMMDQVITSTVYTLDAGLSGEFPVSIGGEDYTIATRYTYAAEPITKATQYTYELFEDMGLPVIYHVYTIGGQQRRNVIAEQQGVSQPERIFMLTAHMDSTSQSPYTNAPGADDNGSGSVGVLIAANILSQYAFDCTIRYALFTGEEQGLVGSYYYAQDAYNNGDDIIEVLNLDMIGYNSDDYLQIELHTRYNNQQDLAIANRFADVVEAYNIDLAPVIEQSGIQASDHASFWDFGYPAILGIEDFEDFTPYYHSIGDQVETLDIDYFTNFIKAAIGTMAHNGCLLNQGTLMGQVTDATPPNMPIPGADVTAQRATGLDYTAQTNDNGNYELSLASGTYTVTAEANGYIPTVLPGIEITTDITTTLDIQLEPCVAADPDFTFSPEEPLSGEPVTFTGLIEPGATEPVDYEWDFGDGHTGVGQVVTHTYTVSGTYTATLTATNCAASVAVQHPVTVTGVPGISVSMQSLDVEVPYGGTLTQTLEIGSDGEMPLTWNLVELPEAPWISASATSGELDPQERQEITLTLDAPLVHGVYTTTLQIDSNDPDQSEIVIPVSLEVPCSALEGLSFEFTPASPRIGESVLFSGGVITGSLPITYTWDFGDGTEPISLVGDPEIGHAFPAAPAVQPYTVSLTAENACTLPLVLEQTVTVTPIQVFLPLMRTGTP
jgi:PKD repeat protein